MPPTYGKCEIACSIGVVGAALAFLEGSFPFRIHTFPFGMGDVFNPHIVLPFVSSMRPGSLLQLATGMGRKITFIDQQSFLLLSSSAVAPAIPPDLFQCWTARRIGIAKAWLAFHESKFALHIHTFSLCMCDVF